MSRSPTAPPCTPPLHAPTSAAPRTARTLQLLRAWRAGDARAGDVLFRELRAWLVVYFRGCPAHEIDDLVQDTLVACVMARHALRRDEAFTSYAFCTARRGLFRHRYHTRADVELDEQRVVDDRSAPLLDERLEARRLLGRCRSPHALVVALRYLEGCYGVEVARTLQISEASVRRRLRRGLDELRRSAGAPVCE